MRCRHLTLGGDLSGDADIALPDGQTVSIPVNLLPVNEKPGEDAKGEEESKYSAASTTMTLDGVPYIAAGNGRR
jgi:hypothetical protein